MMTVPDPQSIGVQGRIAILASADSLFSLLARRVVVPPHCRALVSSDHGSRIARGGEALERNGVRDVMFFSGNPFDIAFSLGPIASRDGFDVQVELALRAELIPESAEASAFRRAFFSRPDAITSAAVARRLHEPAAAAVQEFVNASAAADLVRDVEFATLESRLLDDLRAELFAMGLRIEPGLSLRFQSPHWEAARRDQEAVERRRRRDTAEAEVRQAMAAAREQHLQRLETLLKRLEPMAGAQPNASLGQLIASFAPLDRVDLYRGLMAVRTSPPTEAVLVVAGEELTEWPTHESAAPRRRIAPGGALGPLRSVRIQSGSEGRWVLMGAATGVYALRDGSPEPAAFGIQASSPTRGGVNAAAITGGRLYATHSAFGLVCWSLDAPRGPQRLADDLTRGAAAVRDVQADADGRIWFTAGDRVARWDPVAQAAVASPRFGSVVESACLGRRDVFAGLADGRIVACSIDEPDRPSFRTLRPPTGDAAYSLWYSDGAGVERLLLADGRPLATILFVEDMHSIEFTAPEAVRWAWLADDVVAAVNERRDHLFIWQTARPDQPPARLAVGRACGHSIQDAALLAPADAPATT